MMAFVLCLALCLPGSVIAQSVPRVALGFGVDTLSAAWSEAAWHSHVPEIFRAWSEYLSNQPSMLRPNPRWSAVEQETWIAYDLTRGAAYHGAPATVVDIRPVPGGDEFIVKTLFARTSETQDVRPLALTRVYATREEGRWVFGNALPPFDRGLGADPGGSHRIRGGAGAAVEPQPSRAPSYIRRLDRRLVRCSEARGTHVLRGLGP